MALLIEWGITLHNRMSLCLLVARVALAPSRRIPTCRTCLTYLTYPTYLTCLTCLTCRAYLNNLTYFNKTAPHRRVHHALQPHFPWLAQADDSLDGSSCRCTSQWDRRLDRPVPCRHGIGGQPPCSQRDGGGGACDGPTAPRCLCDAQAEGRAVGDAVGHMPRCIQGT